METKQKTKKIFFISVAVLLLAMAFPGLAGKEAQKLDCKKMVTEVLEAVKNRDFETYYRLSGQDLSQEEKAEFEKVIDQIEKSGELAAIINRMELFPEIGEIPSWVTWVLYQNDYLEDNTKIDLEAEFTLKKDVWALRDFRAEKEKELADQEMEELAEWLSPTAPEGKKTIDAGLNDLMKKFNSALKNKDWDAVRGYCEFWEDSSDEEIAEQLSKMQECTGGKLFEILDRFPTIGSIIVPTDRVALHFRGNLEGKEVYLVVSYGWHNGKATIDVSVDC